MHILRNERLVKSNVWEKLEHRIYDFSASECNWNFKASSRTVRFMEFCSSIWWSIGLSDYLFDPLSGWLFVWGRLKECCLLYRLELPQVYERKYPVRGLFNYSRIQSPAIRSLKCRSRLRTMISERIYAPRCIRSGEQKDLCFTRRGFHLRGEF